MSSTKYVTYEQFGAVGDGVTDDFSAIYAAHEYANENRLSVKARVGACYYIHDTRIDGKVKAVPIKTDTDWTGAEFVIDDSDLDYSNPDQTSMCTTNIFEVLSDYDTLVLNSENSGDLLTKIGSVGEKYGTKKIDVGLGYPAMLIIYNENHGIYRRYGNSYVSKNKGRGQHSPQMELIVVDKGGNVSSETPFMFDYSELTRIDVIRTDVAPITVRGGTVKTIACNLNIIYKDANGNDKHFGYYARGMRVSRSHTVVDGVSHIIEGEISLERQLAGERGAHYSGFFLAMMADSVTLKNCVLQGRRYYGVSGTYDFSGRLVNNIILENCSQRNFWVDADGNPSDTDTGRLSMERVEVDGRFPNYCWGIGGTNFCKNMTYDGCLLSRFDAHQGLYNGKVINSTLSAFEIIGKGDFIVNNVTWYSYNANASSVIALRPDYGSTWNGNIYIDGFKLYATTDSLTLVPHSYRNWYFGYSCYLPNVSVKNLEVFHKDTRKPVDDGYVINVYSRTMETEPGMHLENTEKTPPIAVKWSEAEGKYVLMPDDSRGMANDNPIQPPSLVDITADSSDNKYVYRLVDTSDMRDGGFFGKTKFRINGKEFVGTACQCSLPLEFK